MDTVEFDGGHTDNISYSNLIQKSTLQNSKGKEPKPFLVQIIQNFFTTTLIIKDMPDPDVCNNRDNPLLSPL
jgi:hypothetical protein